MCYIIFMLGAGMAGSLVNNNPQLTASSVPTAPRWVVCWAGAWCRSLTVTTMPAAEGLQQFARVTLFPPLCQCPEGLGMSFSVTLSWRDLPLPYHGGWEEGKVCVPLRSSQRGRGAWEQPGELGRVLMLSRREEPESALPSPPGKSCCSRAAASLSLPWHSRLWHGSPGAVPVPGGSAVAAGMAVSP